MCLINRTRHFCSTPTASLYSQEAVLAIQRGCRATTRRPSFVYKKTIPVTSNHPSDKVKQLVLPFKVIGFAYQSMPLSKVKQLVLLHQLIYFLPTTTYTQSLSWPTGATPVADGPHARYGRTARPSRTDVTSSETSEMLIADERPQDDYVTSCPASLNLPTNICKARLNFG